MPYHESGFIGQDNPVYRFCQLVAQGNFSI